MKQIYSFLLKFELKLFQNLSFVYFETYISLRILGLDGSVF